MTWTSTVIGQGDQQQQQGRPKEGVLLRPVEVAVVPRVAFNPQGLGLGFRVPSSCYRILRPWLNIEAVLENIVQIT